VRGYAVEGSRPSSGGGDPAQLGVSRRQGDQRPAAGRGLAAEKVTVNLTGRSVKALEEAVAVTGNSKTEVINKAVQIFAYILEHIDAGGAVYVREPGGKEAERIRIF
jgi:hypothetical protein